MRLLQLATVLVLAWASIAVAHDIDIDLPNPLPCRCTDVDPAPENILSLNDATPRLSCWSQAHFKQCDKPFMKRTIEKLPEGATCHPQLG